MPASIACALGPAADCRRSRPQDLSTTTPLDRAVLGALLPRTVRRRVRPATFHQSASVPRPSRSAHRRSRLASDRMLVDKHPHPDRNAALVHRSGPASASRQRHRAVFGDVLLDPLCAFAAPVLQLAVDRPAGSIASCCQRNTCRRLSTGRRRSAPRLKPDLFAQRALLRSARGAAAARQLQLPPPYS